MDIARRVGAALLIVAALGIWFGMAPDTGQYADDIESALSDATVNEATADSAPQQQVVNGWAAKDLLAIIAREQTESDQRQTGLTGLLIVAVGLALVTVRPRTGTAPTAQTPFVPDQPTGPAQPATTAPAATGRHGATGRDAPKPAAL